MVTEKISLNAPWRFEKKHIILKEKLDKAIEAAVNKLEKQIAEHGTDFMATFSVDNKYEFGANDNWICGMQTGTYLLAYELTGKEIFRDAAEKQLKSYRERLDNRIKVDDHDVGFVYSPSCVAAYKVLGDKEAYQTALDAAEYFYNRSYSEKGGFILRSAIKAQTNPKGCRTMMDTMLNIPLLFWAGKENGEQKFIDAAISQAKITEKYLIREDASSFHHYQFDVETHKPMHGLTFQGYSDDSCWSRGQSWGVYGFPIAYSYTKDESMISLQRNLTYYMLNHLPEDLIPNWDLIFTKQDEAPRDSSAGLIAVCGMLEMCKYLPEDAPQKKIYENAAAQMLEVVIDKCTGDMGVDYDGLIYHVTAALPQGKGVDECAAYGDYFYLEALIRYQNPDWNRYW